MTQIKNFLSLLNSALNNEPVSELQSPDWDRIMLIAKSQNLLAIVFEKANECADFLSFENYLSYFKMSMQIVAVQTKHTAAFLKLYQSFLDNGISPVVMKGIICRELYGTLRDHRPSGDEDILVKKQEFEASKKILEDNGFVVEDKEYDFNRLDEIQEITFYSKSEPKLVIELHLNPMGHDNDLRYQMDNCFKNVFDNTRNVDINGVSISSLSHTDHFLYLVLHAFRHFTSSGFGIRQTLDILIYEKNYYNGIDWKYITDVLKKLDAYLFLSDMIIIGNTYLGFELPTLAEPNCPEELLSDMIDSGVFGNATQEQRSAAQMTGAAVTAKGKNKKSGMLKTVLGTLFPDKKRMLNMYPELEKKPWLLPLRWIQRFGRFAVKNIRRGKSSEGNLAAKSLKISRKRIELLKKYGIL